MRINKYIAECGVASRRAADKMIAEKRVSVNGKIVTELGIDIKENIDKVYVDGVQVKPASSYTYIMFNKPKGCVCTSSDDKGRKTVFDYIDINERLFCVGRLDYDSEGLLLLTNDGELAYQLTHPSYEIPKTYIVHVEGEVVESDLAKLRKGVVIDGEMTHRAKIKLKGFDENISRFEMTIYEGKNRQIRKMFEAIGKNVVFLRRVAVGDLRVGGLGRGLYRYLNDKEIEYLKRG